MINSVYDYYLTTYGNKQVSKNDTHKKSELRSVYNNIVKLSRKSPLYKLNATEDIQKYAIDLKETARGLKNVAESFDSSIDDNEGFFKKKAYSSNEDVLDVKYIGSETPDNSDDTISFTVEKLAAPQINTGDYLTNSSCSLKEGAYSFDCKISGNTYEFQFNINRGESNSDVQNKLARLFNKSGIGLEARVNESSSGNTSLEIRSSATGVMNYEGNTFSISPNDSNNSANAVKYFGINNISNMPENAVFTVNSNTNSSASNTFTINKQFEITLKDTTDADDSPVTIGFKHDIDTFMDNADSLISSYNDMLSLANEKADDSYDGSKLIRETRSLSKRHSTDLESSGITIDDKGYLSLDRALLTQSFEEDGIASFNQKLSSFKKDILSRADSISLNPMNYVNKTLISYPNPTKSYVNPYMTSIYTGMMFNSYI